MSEEERQLQSQPMVVLGDESERVKDKDAQEHNIRAAKQVSDAVRTTLGPKGMDKMLVGSTGDVTITNDGVTILEQMDIDNPTAEMVVEVAETQEEDAGDGTTTAVAVAGELLNRSEELLDQDVHPSAVVNGFRKASEKTREELDEIAVEATDERLEQLARTAMTGRGTDIDREHLARLVVDAVGSVEADEVEEFVETVTQTGGSVTDSRLVDGAVLDDGPAHIDMPTEFESATVLLLDEEIGLEETETDASISVDGADHLQEVIQGEEEQIKEKVALVEELGADVVVSSEDIDDVASHLFAKGGVLAVENADDVEFLSRVTSADVVSDLESATGDELGTASVSRDGDLLYFEGEGSDAVTLVLRGGTEHVVEELERGISDAVDVVSVASRDGKVLGGGGAPEVELALRLRDFSEGVPGREQLAVEAFADALEVVPRTLAENSGLDPIDSLVELRNAHESGDEHAGLDVENGGTTDSLDDGVVESVAVKSQAFSSAEEVANMILRIDDIISADVGDSADGGGAGGMPGGGMGGMM